MPAGYFIWSRSGNKNVAPSPSAHDAVKHAAEKRDHSYWWIAEHPLSEDEMKLTLAQLVEKYPCPK